MTSKGTVAEGLFLRMLLEHGIEAEHGSPSRPGDIIVPPNVIIEIKDPKGNSYSFKQHSGKGEAQWRALKEKKEKFPWLEILYVVRFGRKEWRYFESPEDVKPLKLREGQPLEALFEIIRVRQASYEKAMGVQN